MMTIILKGVMGSHCHNLDTCTSDTDVRGVGLKADPAYLFGIKRFDQLVVQNDEEDTTIWELRKFVRLCLKCNTNGLNLLFCEERSLTRKNEFGERLREIRHRFLSNRAYPVLRGYYNAEYKYTMGEKTGRLGDKRKKAIQEHGYSVKNASHCLRLLKTGITLFKKGTYPVWFDGGDQKTLLAVKTGQVAKQDFELLFSQHIIEFESAFQDTKLPNVPDEASIWAEVQGYLLDVVEACWQREKPNVPKWGNPDWRHARIGEKLEPYPTPTEGRGAP